MNPIIAYTAGVWDLLHRGHINLLWRTRQLCDVMIVGVVWDDGVFAYKGIFPRENFQLRMRKIEQLGFVNAVVEQRTTDPSENLRRFMPDLMTHGDDWSRLLQGHETLEKLHIEYVPVPYTAGISSSMLRAERVA